jgi:hypothetical protein
MKALGLESTTPSESIEFGDPALLDLEMIFAAAYWGIDVPIAKYRLLIAGRRWESRFMGIRLIFVIFQIQRRNAHHQRKARI